MACRSPGRAASKCFALSLQVRAGEFVAILGPSGCGKSTLLNLLSGFQQPDQRQRIRINGNAAVKPEMPELGYVFQSPQPVPVAERPG
jgi:NitT/TauT family transport system ATP-binding protein